MSRILLLILTGVCAAPLFALAGAAITAWMAGTGGNSDTTIANGIMALLAGIVSGAAGGIGSALLAAHLVPRRFERRLLIGDGVAICIWVTALYIATWEPAQLSYDGYQPQIEAEVRVDKAAYPENAVGSIYFRESLLDSLHDDRRREEAGYIITPWDAIPYKVWSWNIDVLLNGHEKWIRFPVDLPARPSQSTDWSDWLLPIAVEGHETPQGVELRYRFRLIPYGSP